MTVASGRSSTVASSLFCGSTSSKIGTASTSPVAVLSRACDPPRVAMRSETSVWATSFFVPVDTETNFRKFVSVSTGTKNDVAQTEVSLRIATRGGSHARLNTATGEVEAVPILLEVEPQNRLEATVEERPDATVIKLRFLT